MEIQKKIINILSRHATVQLLSDIMHLRPLLSFHCITHECELNKFIWL